MARNDAPALHLVHDWFTQGGMRSRITVILLALVCTCSWLFTLHVARSGFHMTPDAVDYLTIARRHAMGDGWTIPIKWHWFNDAPAVHSALGERSIGWPALARIAVAIDPANPGPSAQILNTVLIGIAAAIWGGVAAMVTGSAIAAWLMAALLLTSSTTLLVTTAPLTEPLYMVELGLLAMVIGGNRHGKVSAPLAGILMGLVGMAAYLTRPSGPVVIVAIPAHLLIARPRAWRTMLGLWLITTIPLFGAFHFAVWRAWGDPFHNLTGHHFAVMSITEAMFSGWGHAWPTAGEFLAARWREIAPKWGEHLLLHTEALLAPGALFLLSPLLALVAVSAMTKCRGWALLWLLAAGHWLGAVILWASTEPTRLAMPAVICALPLCLGAGMTLLKEDSGRGLRSAAVFICIAMLAIGAVGMAMKARVIAATAWPIDLASPPVPVDFDPARVVCTDSPFALAYRSDVACVVFPFDLPERAGDNPVAIWSEFIRDLQVSHFALQSQRAFSGAAPLIEAGVLRQLPDWPDPQFAWFEVAMP